MRDFQLKGLGLPILLAVSCVALIDLFTNSLEVQKYAWDFHHYINMAEEGLGGSSVAPYAYRYGSTLPVHVLHEWFGLKIHASFKIIAYLGAISTLTLVHVFARYLGFSRGTGLLCMLVVAASRMQVKFLVFDHYRPDHLAYPLMLIAMMLLLRKRWWLCVAVSVVGLQIREFLIVPIVLTMFSLFRETCIHKRIGKRRGLVALALMAAVVAVAIVLPRLLIEVERSRQLIDPVNKPRSLLFLFDYPLRIKRNINFVLSLLTFLLPSLVLVTSERVRFAWRACPTRWVWVAYSALVLVLAMYGGTDHNRFMAYLFLPQVVLLAYMFESRPTWVEIVYMLVVVVLVNKIFFEIPIWKYNVYINEFGGWNGEVNLATVRKYVFVGSAVVGAATLRAILSSARFRPLSPG